MRKQGVTEVKRVSIKKKTNRNEHLHNDIQPAQNTGEDKKNRLYNREGRTIHTQSTAMLQLSEIRPSQG